MTVRDLFNFVYPDLEKRNLILSLMTRVECNIKNNHIRLYHGYEEPKNITLTDFDNAVENGYYLYFKYAHFDDEIFFKCEDIDKAYEDYEKENIYKKPCLIMAKKILKVDNDKIEEIKSDEWKD